MDDLPEEVAWEILKRVNATVDKNSISLTCKRLHVLDNEQRRCIRVGCGLVPANEGLISLCHRFRNLENVEISYWGWMSKLGKQLDDRGLYNLSISCPQLTVLTLSYCTYITDGGLSHLASCSHLSSLNLIFAPRISGCGVLSVVVGCKNLSVLHLNRCLNVASVEWLEYLGKLEKIRDLQIKNCRGIGECDLVKLGNSWRNLRSFHFEVDANYRYMKLHDRLAVDQWQTQLIRCSSMREIKLVNCITTPARYLACILGKCKNMEKIHLDMCLGVGDADIIEMASHSRNLRAISLRVPSGFSLATLMNNPIRLTDECLKALALNCSNLESVRLSFGGGEFPSLPSFTQEGILALIQKCPVRELCLNHIYSFNDAGMEALCSAQHLELLELIKCQEISDKGLQLVVRFPRLCVLKLNMCLGLSDYGLQPFLGSHKLKLLVVDDCPEISERGALGAAESVRFRQDLSWLD